MNTIAPTNENKMVSSMRVNRYRRMNGVDRAVAQAIKELQAEIAAEATNA